MPSLTGRWLVCCARMVRGSVFLRNSRPRGWVRDGLTGPEAALDFWRGRDDFELVLCTDDNHIIVTEGLEEVFQLYDQDGGYTYEIARR